LQAKFDENEIRKQFTVSDRVALDDDCVFRSHSATDSMNIRPPVHGHPATDSTAIRPPPRAGATRVLDTL